MFIRYCPTTAFIAFLTFCGALNLAIATGGVAYHWEPLMISGLAADPVATARPLLLFVLLPIALGMTIYAVSERAAIRARAPVAPITNVAGVLLLVLIGVIHGASVIHAVGSFAIATQPTMARPRRRSIHLLSPALPDLHRHREHLRATIRGARAATTTRHR